MKKTPHFYTRDLVSGEILRTFPVKFVRIPVFLTIGKSSTAQMYGSKAFVRFLSFKVERQKETEDYSINLRIFLSKQKIYKQRLFIG